MSTRPPRVTVVRPYGDRVRSRVFDVLRHAGLEVGVVVPPGTPDEQALDTTLRAGAPRVVVPFHAHHDREGRALDGLRFARLLLERWSAVRVVMPVSRFGAAAMSIAAVRGVVPTGVLLVDESELDTQDVVARVRAHLGR